MSVTPEQLEQLIKLNKQLKASLAAAQAEIEELKSELKQAVGAVREVFDSILDANGRVSMAKAMGLINNYGKVEKSITELMQIVEKHG